MSYFNLKTLPLGRPGRQCGRGELSVGQAWLLHHKLMGKGAVPKRPYLPCDPHGQIKCNQDDCTPLRIFTHCYGVIPGSGTSYYGLQDPESKFPIMPEGPEPNGHICNIMVEWLMSDSDTLKLLHLEQIDGLCQVVLSKVEFAEAHGRLSLLYHGVATTVRETMVNRALKRSVSVNGKEILGLTTAVKGLNSATIAQNTDSIAQLHVELTDTQKAVKLLQHVSVMFQPQCSFSLPLPLHLSLLALLSRPCLLPNSPGLPLRCLCLRCLCLWCLCRPCPCRPCPCRPCPCRPCPCRPCPCLRCPCRIRLRLN
jgi:hypothetical protein